MAKKGLVESNLRKEKCVQRFAAKRISLKSIAKDRSVSLQDRFAATMKLAELPRNSSSTRLRNRCFFSGRPRAVYAKLGLSRIALREFASSGLIPGFVKSSW